MKIVNVGPAIVSTSYWLTENAKHGLLYLSVNAGALRLLLPSLTERTLLADLPPEGTACELTHSMHKGNEMYLFVWGCDLYGLEIDQRQCDRRLPRSEEGRILPLLWYGQSGTDGVVEKRRELVQLGRIIAS